MSVYLIRHGETPARPGRPSESNAIGLTPSGRRAAEKRGAWLARHGVARIVTSPLARAKETADVLALRHGLLVTVDARAREFTPADVAAPYFKPARDRARRERDWAGEGGESFTASVGRLTDLLAEIGDAPTPIAIVTHELVLQNLLLTLGYSTPPSVAHLGGVELTHDQRGWRVVSRFEPFSLRALLGRLAW